MRPILTVLIPILLIGSVMGSEPAWKAKELERKARVQVLINQLADDSTEKRQVAYSELRDTFVRKRDIPELTKEIARTASPEVKKSLGELIPFIDGKWRLPDKGWTNDLKECGEAYRKEFRKLGCGGYQVPCDYRPKFFELEMLDFPAEAEVRRDVIDLILTLEPESLRLWGAPDSSGWESISFVSSLSNLEELTLTLTLVTDLTPLKGLPKLNQLNLLGGKVTDLAPLKGLSSLRELVLDEVPVTDLTPLKGLTGLRKLSLLDTPVTDLTPLEGLPNLKTLHVPMQK